MTENCDDRSEGCRLSHIYFQKNKDKHVGSVCLRTGGVPGRTKFRLTSKSASVALLGTLGSMQTLPMDLFIPIKYINVL